MSHFTSVDVCTLVIATMIINTFVLGTTYFQQDQPLLIMAGFCVYSVASALFMFPVMQNYFIKALEVYVCTFHTRVLIALFIIIGV